MKIIDEKMFAEIRTWIYRNARPLELALWKYHYEGGKGEDIIGALSCYQNEDGGFGNGIEPDCWNGESSPYATFKAIEMLRKTELINTLGSKHPMVEGIFRYLDSGIHSNEYGWYFCIPTNDNAPRAPWWSYSEEANRLQTMGITTAICAFVLRYGAQWTQLYQTAYAHVQRILKQIKDTDDFGEMGIGGVVVLLRDLMECGLTGEFDCDGVLEKLSQTVNAAIERDSEQWQYYKPRPSAFIWSPDSPFYKGNEEIVEVQLDYLIDTRTPEGVWNINWIWFHLGEQYPKEFAISENWWKSIVAMDNLEFLKAFGRVGE